jgi:SPP1 gp7 family putative phage head morphogenesis protein
VEKEHIKTVNYDENVVIKIAIDHLREDPNYYDKLEEVENKGHLNYDPHNENYDPKNLDDFYTRGVVKKKNPLVLDIDEKPTEEKLIGALHFILEENEKKIIELIGKEIRPNKVGEIKSLTDIIETIKRILGLGPTKDISDALIGNMFMNGWDKTEKQIGRNLAPNREAIEFIKKYTFDNIDGMTKEIMDDLRQELERGLMNNEGIDKLTERVKKVFQTGKTRAEMIAVTESHRAHEEGRILAFRESGEEYEKKWVAHIDDRTCEHCKRMNGQKIGINENFKDKQTGFNSDIALFHPRCRCISVIIPKEK